MAEAHVKQHDYHVVDPSPWPIIGSVAALIATSGGVIWMHGGTSLIAIVGILGIMYTMFGWWRDVIRESRAGFHTPVVVLGLRYGVILFIASEVMFFVAWFWAFFDASLFVGEAINFQRMEFTGGHWPPTGIEAFDPWHLPLLNTLILLTSGTTVTWAHHAIVHGDRQGLKYGLWCTVALGFFFSLMQAYEYSHAHFGFSGNIYGATFFMSTGFHGFHVIVGTIFLAVCLLRAYVGDFTPKKHFGFEAAAWYWHFVDVVWLFLFTFVYVWASAGSATH
ncbi:cytochrome c oxidase subunit 3 [Xanthobacter tagetidis]|jgi:cytochrome c oxidase subunit 3|uniref:Cytochrome c oxidase subunit 3 n=1 Tax=Xanthobacter tagetidis TaxID=60216 RepID=A0A3L7ALQ8_9HYPH|nr:cytochrome c oxidase subunit 3 [Xanthobacter tagetidis]MBB6307646.1 cytochrome c oxidase subunit 3 [Xanthobacter tagetidis]RLP81207.1 cytochrome c oxidase subunit 3 [Xanthobacter tagetidis]